MDRHAVRRAALPHDEDDLRAAFADGRLDEHSWCELKRELPPKSKETNLELAKDLASLAVDGGSLYIGVDEKAPDGDPLRPQLLAGLRERIDQVARARVTPALFVETYEIRAARQPGFGYLEVVVPASADAPHQVQGAYYGRSDTGKCRLSDQQVERLMRERDQQRHLVDDRLRAFIAADPHQGADQSCPNLFAVESPGVRRSEMCRSVIGADQRWQPLLQMLTDVVNDVISPIYAAANLGRTSVLEILVMGPRRITGGVTLASWPVGESRISEDRHQELSVDEDGDLSFYHASVGWDGEPVNGVPRKVLSAAIIAASVREFMAAIVAISQAAHAPGTWSIGIALNGIRGYRHKESGWPNYGPPSNDNDYFRIERFNLAALARTPGDATEKLLGRLLRGLQADADQLSKHCSSIPPQPRLAARTEASCTCSGSVGRTPIIRSELV